MVIFETLFNAIFGALHAVLNLLPTLEVQEVNLGGLGQMIQSAAWFLPMNAIFLCLGVVITIQIYLNGIWGGNWIAKRIRGG